jgi:phage terminase large subunit GpA-like protein
MIVLPSKEMARSYSETRFQPSIEDSPVLRAEKPDDPDQYKLLEMHFRRCSVFLTGANSAANLKSRGIGVLHASEVDTWPMASERETGALQQAMERLKDRPGSKAIIESTPTIESGQIWYEFQLGDQRYFFIQCPDCKTFQSLKFPQIKWPEDCRDNDGRWRLAEVKRLSRYHCEKCDAPWNDGQKLAQLRGGEWQPTNTAAEIERRSYHLSSLYPAWITYGEVAVQFLKSKDNHEELQRVVNSWFAEPYYLGGLKGEFEKSIAARAVEASADVPEGYRTFMTIDVQQDHLRFVIRAFAKNGDSLRYEYGQLPGFEEAEMVAKRWKCVVVGADARFRQQQVLAWCASHSGWVPMIGADGLMTDIRWTDIPIDGGALKGHVVKSLRFRPNSWKEELYKRIKRMKEDVPTWGIVGQMGKDYQKEMTGEARNIRRGSRGQMVIEWVKHGPNHYWDCEVEQLALFDASRVFIFNMQEEKMEVSAPPSLPSGPLVGELEEIARARRNASGGNELGEITERLW